MPKAGVSTAASRRREVDNIRTRARFAQFVIPADMGPAEILVDEMRRSAGFVFWIEAKLSEWDDQLIDLQQENYDDKGALQTATTNSALWLAVWQREREHLAKVAKLCLDAGVEERLVKLAEQQAEVMFGLINQAFDALELTQDQQKKAITVLPGIVRKLTLPEQQEVPA